jgi:hypothetical protein
MGPSEARHGLSPGVVETFGGGHIEPVKQVSS